MNGRIVVGIDDTAEAWIALHWAIGEALSRKRPIRIVHAYNRHPRDDRPAKTGQEIHAAAMGIVHQRIGMSSASGALVLGDPVSVLARESAGSALLVIGSRRAGTSPDRLDSVSAGLVGKLKCPILTVRENQGDLPVVAGVKRLEVTDGMLRFAFAEAYERGRRLSLVHYEERIGSSGIEDDLIEAATSLGQAHPGVTFAIRVLPGDPVAGLIARSGGASLLIVGTHDLPGSRSSQQVLHGAQSSVAVVPA